MKKFITVLSLALYSLFVSVNMEVKADAMIPMLTIYESAGTNKDHELLCMARNIYFEARSDNLAGKYAVADVVLNRVKDRRYPATICEVVEQGPKVESWTTKKDKNLPDSDRVYNPVRNMCQFSWYCDGKDDIPKNKDRWAEAKDIAYNILYMDKHRGITEGATHYHATYVRPDWSYKLQQIGRIGLHLFYRWP
jgi:spore germination cell wall hydrolase CwlJ-like protein